MPDYGQPVYNDLHWKSTLDFFKEEEGPKDEFSDFLDEEYQKLGDSDKAARDETIGAFKQGEATPGHEPKGPYTQSQAGGSRFAAPGDSETSLSQIGPKYSMPPRTQRDDDLEAPFNNSVEKALLQLMKGDSIEGKGQEEAANRLRETDPYIAPHIREYRPATEDEVDDVEELDTNRGPVRVVQEGSPKYDEDNIQNNVEKSLLKLMKEDPTIEKVDARAIGRGIVGGLRGEKESPYGKGPTRGIAEGDVDLETGEITDRPYGEQHSLIPFTGRGEDTYPQYRQGYRGGKAVRDEVVAGMALPGRIGREAKRQVGEAKDGFSWGREGFAPGEMNRATQGETGQLPGAAARIGEVAGRATRGAMAEIAGRKESAEPPPPKESSVEKSLLKLMKGGDEPFIGPLPTNPAQSDPKIMEANQSREQRGVPPIKYAPDNKGGWAQQFEPLPSRVSSKPQHGPGSEPRGIGTRMRDVAQNAMYATGIKNPARQPVEEQARVGRQTRVVAGNRTGKAEMKNVRQAGQVSPGGVVRYPRDTGQYLKSLEETILKLMKEGDTQELNAMGNPPKENKESQALVADGDSKRPKSEVGTNDKMFKKAYPDDAHPIDQKPGGDTRGIMEGWQPGEGPKPEGSERAKQLAKIRAKVEARAANKATEPPTDDKMFKKESFPDSNMDDKSWEDVKRQLEMREAFGADHAPGTHYQAGETAGKESHNTISDIPEEFTAERSGAVPASVYRPEEGTETSTVQTNDPRRNPKVPKVTVFRNSTEASPEDAKDIFRQRKINQHTAPEEHPVGDVKIPPQEHIGDLETTTPGVKTTRPMKGWKFAEGPEGKAQMEAWWKENVDKKPETPLEETLFKLMKEGEVSPAKVGMPRQRALRPIENAFPTAPPKTPRGVAASTAPANNSPSAADIEARTQPNNQQEQTANWSAQQAIGQGVDRFNTRFGSGKQDYMATRKRNDAWEAEYQAGQNVDAANQAREANQGTNTPPNVPEPVTQNTSEQQQQQQQQQGTTPVKPIYSSTKK
jgi:hypothetical protein